MAAQFAIFSFLNGNARLELVRAFMLEERFAGFSPVIFLGR